MKRRERCGCLLCPEHVAPEQRQLRLQQQAAQYSRTVRIALRAGDDERAAIYRKKLVGVRRVARKLNVTLDAPLIRWARKAGLA